MPSPSRHLYAAKEMRWSTSRACLPLKNMNCCANRSSFSAYKPDEQKRLRQLHEQIQEDARCEELRGIMERYYEWYKLLPAFSRDELTDSSPDEQRIKLIKKLIAEEQS